MPNSTLSSLRESEREAGANSGSFMLASATKPSSVQLSSVWRQKPSEPSLSAHSVGNRGWNPGA